jgi:dephospho-CoA kinase
VSINHRKFLNLRHYPKINIYTGHETYRVDTDAYKKVIETFGEEIVNPVVRSIDRKILGKKVFQSPDELKKPTDIVWPAILNFVQERIENSFKEGNKANFFLNKF